MSTLVLFGAAVLSGLGVGSGGLYLLYLTDVLGVGQYAAQGQNLLFFILATLASALLHLGRGSITLKELLPFGAVGLFGTVLGVLLTLVTPPALARRAFGLFMILGGGLSLFRSFRYRRARGEGKNEKKPPPPSEAS